jgi:putative nucleotidyltransferase with HDIG domain
LGELSGLEVQRMEANRLAAYVASQEVRVPSSFTKPTWSADIKDNQNSMTQLAGTSKASESAGLQWYPGSIPPFPAIALKALKLMSGTDTSLLELCNLVRSDHAFSVAILKIANSPLVAFPKTVTSVLQASMLLGFQRLRSVVVTVGLKAYLEDGLSPLMQSCWRHSVACAIIAERSAKRRFLDKDFAYTAGILHDIGRVAMASMMPQAYTRVVERGADRPQDVLQSEREFCGIDHCQAGRSLVIAWNLPDTFAEITACHHGQGTCSTGTASLIAPSCALASFLGYGAIRYRSSVSYDEVLAQFPEPARDNFPAVAQELADEIENEISMMESV